MQISNSKLNKKIEITFFMQIRKQASISMRSKTRFRSRIRVHMEYTWFPKLINTSQTLTIQKRNLNIVPQNVLEKKKTSPGLDWCELGNLLTCNTLVQTSAYSVVVTVTNRTLVKPQWVSKAKTAQKMEECVFICTYSERAAIICVG